MRPVRTLALTAVTAFIAGAVLFAALVPLEMSSRASAAPATKNPTAASNASAAQANAVLQDLKTRFRYLDGVTVTFGATPGSYQAVSYYKEGRIVINPRHTASVEEILDHEIWHIIDWRDNGRVDWHERVPPANAASYLTKS